MEHKWGGINAEVAYCPKCGWQKSKLLINRYGDSVSPYVRGQGRDREESESEPLCSPIRS